MQVPTSRAVQAGVAVAVAALGFALMVGRGLAETAVIIVLAAVLFGAYTVRHRVRSRLLYDRSGTGEDR